jgi:hypothetical protein
MAAVLDNLLLTVQISRHDSGNRVSHHYLILRVTLPRGVDLGIPPLIPYWVLSDTCTLVFVLSCFLELGGLLPAS